MPGAEGLSPASRQERGTILLSGDLATVWKFTFVLGRKQANVVMMLQHLWKWKFGEE